MELGSHYANEFYLFHLQGITAEFSVKSVHRLGLSLSPRQDATGHSKAVIMMYYLE